MKRCSVLPSVSYESMSHCLYILNHDRLGYIFIFSYFEQPLYFSSAVDTYSAFPVELPVMVCFLLAQPMAPPPHKTILPLVEFLSDRSPVWSPLTKSIRLRLSLTGSLNLRLVYLTNVIKASQSLFVGSVDFLHNNPTVESISVLVRVKMYRILLNISWYLLSFGSSSPVSFCFGTTEVYLRTSSSIFKN